MYKIHPSAKIHPTSIIDEGASIGSLTKIWHWVHISGTATIGSNCNLGQNVFVSDQVIIGDNVKIQNNVSIYNGVQLEDNVFCGPSMVFTNVLNPRSAFSRINEYKKTIVKKGSTLGANCTIICGITIGENSFIGAGSVVTKSIKSNALCIGNPAKQVGWMSDYGEKIPLPLEGEGLWKCKRTNAIYTLKGDQLTKTNIVKK